jgi:hypothetical protein
VWGRSLVPAPATGIMAFIDKENPPLSEYFVDDCVSCT